MKGPLEAHEENVAKRGPLKRRVDVHAALAELQEQLAKVDKTFKPKHDVRPTK